MAQALHLSQKMTLSQVLAPQLQQSLALLQAPTLELKAMVAQELEQNPMLEELEITEELFPEWHNVRSDLSTEIKPGGGPVTLDLKTRK